MALFLNGCATIIKGSDQALIFQSSPEGAQVIIDGVPVGVTPLTIKLPKNTSEVVMVKKEGYATKTIPITKHFDGVTALSFFWDFSTTDFLSGAAYEYSPNSYYFELKKNN